MSFGVLPAPPSLLGITWDATHKPLTRAVASVDTATGEEKQVLPYPSTYFTLQSAYDEKGGVLYLADISMQVLNPYIISEQKFLPAVSVNATGCEDGFCFFDFGWDAQKEVIVAAGVGFDGQSVCLVSINPKTGAVAVAHRMKSPDFQTCGFLQESGTFDAQRRVYYGVFTCIVNATNVDLTTAIKLGNPSQEHIVMTTNPRQTPFPSTFASGFGLLSHANGTLIKIDDSGARTSICKGVGSPERHSQLVYAPGGLYYAIIVNGSTKSLVEVDLYGGSKRSVALSGGLVLTELAWAPSALG